MMDLRKTELIYLIVVYKPKQAESEDITMKYKYIYTMKCLDDDKAIITGMNPKAPILIEGTNERYLILPVNISQDDELEEKINQLIRDAA